MNRDLAKAPTAIADQLRRAALSVPDDDEVAQTNATLFVAVAVAVNDHVYVDDNDDVPSRKKWSSTGVQRQ